MLNLKKLLTKLLPVAYSSPATGWEQIYQNFTRAKRKGYVVAVTGESGSGGITLPANQYKDIATLPSQYRPSTTVAFYVDAAGGSERIFGRIWTTGVVSLYSSGQTAYWNFGVTYIVD